MTASVRRTALALCLTVLLVASAVAAPVAGSNHQSETETADEVYVADDGSVVLIYEESRTAGETAEGQFGVDVGEDLVYGHLNDSVESQPDVRWNVSALAEPSRFETDGNLTAPRPESLESFDLSITGHSTEEDSRADVDLAATIAGEGGGMGAFVQSASTEGELAMRPDSLSLTGSFDVQSMAVGQESQRESLTLSETEDGYVLSVERSRLLSSFTADDWANRSAARETIRDEYGVAEGSSGPSADVTIDSYSLSEADGDRQRLETSFTVEYTNVDETVRQLVVAGLSEPQGASDEQAQRLADELLAANLEEVSYSYTVGDGSASGDFAVEVSDYDGLVLAYLDYAQSVEEQAGFPGNAERVRSQFEAQQAADLEQRYTWDGELQGSQDGGLTLDLSMDYRTANWAAYVDEVQSRDLPWSSSEFALNGTTEADRVTMQGFMEMEGDRLFANVANQFGGGMAEGEAMPEWFESLARSEPRRARFDASYDADGLQVEGGAAFGNLSALSEAIGAEYGASSVSEVIGRTEGDTSRIYVRVDDALGGDSSESAVRELASVDDETTIHESGSWSEDDIPSMDVERAQAFVQPGQSSGAFGPGFGPVVAVIALLGAALFLRRRR